MVVRMMRALISASMSRPFVNLIFESPGSMSALSLQAGTVANETTDDDAPVE